MAYQTSRLSLQRRAQSSDVFCMNLQGLREVATAAAIVVAAAVAEAREVLMVIECWVVLPVTIHMSLATGPDPMGEVVDLCWWNQATAFVSKMFLPCW